MVCAMRKWSMRGCTGQLIGHVYSHYQANLNGVLSATAALIVLIYGDVHDGLEQRSVLTNGLFACELYMGIQGCQLVHEHRQVLSCVLANTKKHG